MAKACESSDMKPFRFAAGIRRTASRAEYVEAVRDIERLGYSAVMLSDHLVDQLAPISALGVAAAVTSTLRLGTFVFNNDLRHPAVLAQELATLDRLSDGLQEPGKETTLVQEIERVLRLKVREVKQYIDPAATLGFAVAAVPDPVFNACRRAHLEAYREGVILMPYSMTIPYVLALFRLHLQYAKSIDLENLEGYLQQIDDNVASLDRLLENSIARGSTMIQNAFTDAKRNLGQMRGALAAMRAVPQAALGQEPEIDRVEEQPDLQLLISRRA